MEKMNKKGFYPLFTTLGVLLVIMVLGLTIQWSSASGRAYDAHIDRLSWLRINHAVGNLEAMISASLKEPLYKAILEVGRIPEGYTTNPFLEQGSDEGWAMIMDNITKSVSADFREILPQLADDSAGGQSTFVFENGINITVGELRADGLELIEAGDDGIAAVVRLPMIVTNRYQGWEATLYESNMTIPLNVRLKDMYGRAWEFNRNYEDNVRWLTSGFIYGRAYLGAYCNKGLEATGICSTSGPFLRKGHFDFDPIGVLLFGDYETVKGFASDPGKAKDMGAVPIATWAAETWYLSEPSFLPPGFDISSEDEEQLEEAISGAFSSEELEEEACSGFSGSEREDCEMMYDTGKLRDEVARLEDQKDAYEDIIDPLEDWLDKYDMSAYDACKSCAEERDICEDKCDATYDACVKKCTSSSCRRRCRDRRESCEDRCDERYDECDPNHKEECQHDALNQLFKASASECDEFRDKATGIIAEVIDFLDDIEEDQCQAAIDYADDNYADEVSDPAIHGNFISNDEDYGFDEIDDYCGLYEDALTDLGDVLVGDLKPSDISDSACLDSGRKGDCLFDDQCEDEDDCDVTCRPPRCAGSGDSYDCVGDKPLGYARVEECRVCSDSGRCRDESDSIDQCTCRCRPSADLIKRLNADFALLLEYAEKVLDTLERNIEKLEEQLERQGKLEELEGKLESSEAERIKYDVFSRIDPDHVMYDKGEGVGGKLCYYDHTLADVENGVCGDSIESVVTYTIQVALASFIGATAFAADFFPMFFETEAGYNLTETLIDDGNRVVLRNVAGDGGAAYLYAPFEFEIYKDREFSMASATLGRTIVYVYLKAVSGGMGRVIDGLASEECGGESC